MTILNVLEFHAEMRDATGKPKLAKELRMVKDTVAQLVVDHRNALAILEHDGQGNSPAAAFLRASLVRAGFAV